MLTRFIRFQGFNLKKKDLRIKKFCDELKNKFKHKSDHILLSLSKSDLRWDMVDVFLGDERCVDANS